MLGALALGHTVYRLLFGIATTPYLAPWMLVHLLLATSALQFRVPRRATAHVMDALYRAQVLVFSLRSVLVILITLWAPSPLRLRLRFAAIVACHAAADACERALRAPGEAHGGVRRSMRPGDGKAPPTGWVLDYARLFFAVAQLNATSQMVWVHNEAYVLIGAFMTLVVVQVTAFLQTLRKKGLLSPSAWKGVYAGMLLSVALQMAASTTVGELIVILAVSAVYAGLRLSSLHANKYLLLTLAYAWAELTAPASGAPGYSLAANNAVGG